LLHGFGRSIAVASLEQLLKTHQPPRPLSVAEWLNIAEQQRAALARAVAQSWQLPASIAEAVCSQDRGASSLNDLVLYADGVAAELDVGRMPEAKNLTEARALDELVAGLPAALDAFAPPLAPLTMRPSPPSPHLAKPERALEGELRKKALAVVDRRTKAAANLTCLSLAPAGIEVDSSKPFQEGCVVRLAVGDAEARFEPWLTVVLCVPQAPRYRVELQLF
jgi:hypothetical protein